MPQPALSLETIDHLLAQVAQTETLEITCAEAYRCMDQYADSVSGRGDREPSMLFLQQHLALCPDCREEHLTLVRALAALEA